MAWFKLTIPKGNLRKRAHKKWLKKTGVWDYLKSVTKLICEEIEKNKKECVICGRVEMIIQDKTCPCCVALKRGTWSVASGDDYTLPDVKLGVSNA